MSDKSGGFPWGSLAVLLAFAASTQLRPGAFDQLRPPERERAQPTATVELEVEARLWEDPFTAVRRHETERLERCDKQFKDAEDLRRCRAAPSDSRAPSALRDRLSAEYLREKSFNPEVGTTDSRADGQLIMVVMVPGSSFVGAEETRRRTRYALLAGLQSQGYLPDNAERIGLLALQIAKRVQTPPPASTPSPTQTPKSTLPAGKGRVATSATPTAPAASSTSSSETTGTEPLLAPVEILSSNRLRTRRTEQLEDQARAASGAIYPNQVEPWSEKSPTPELYDRVVVVWIDETALPAPKLDALARVLDAVYRQKSSWARGGPDEPFYINERKREALVIIGPSSTDALRTGLLDLRDTSRSIALQKDTARKQSWKDAKLGSDQIDLQLGLVELSNDTSGIPGYCKPNAFFRPASLTGRPSGPGFDSWLRENQEHPYEAARLRGYWFMTKAQFINPFSTASDDMLNVFKSQDLDGFLNRQFCRMFEGRFEPPIRMTRTIATDDHMMGKLVDELKLRLPQSKRRVIILTERDSLYTQALHSELRKLLKRDDKLELDEAYFFRGLDGVTTKEAKKDDTKALPSAAIKQGPIEWPERADQLDYLRGLARDLKASETPPGEKPRPIGAIGILASDVHDKLLIMQALRDSFPDRVFFTTDMDSRLTHPRTQAFTRNLLVASSLPLTFPDDKNCLAPDGSKLSLRGKTLDGGNPPWRDVYQASTYLAARLASCRSESCRKVENCVVQQALNSPSLYEIGRQDAVVLSGYALDRKLGGDSYGWGLASLALLLIISFCLWVWPGAPSARAAAKRWRCPPQDRTSFGFTAWLMVTLYALAGGLTLGSLIEILWPGHLTLTWIAAASALSATLAIVSLLKVGAPAVQGSNANTLNAWLLRLASIAALSLWAAPAIWAWSKAAHSPCRDCEPKFWAEGVSAWPSHLLHLLALFCVIWTVDQTWDLARRGLSKDTDWLVLPTTPARPPGDPASPIDLPWYRQFGLFGWRPQRRSPPAAGMPSPDIGVDAAALWHEYLRRANPRPRALRVAFEYMVTIGVIGLIYVAWSAGDVLELPVRGQRDRDLIGDTLGLCLLGLPLVVVVVGDAIVLVSRFIRQLGEGRSFYPEATLEKFALALGEKNAVLWQTPIARTPRKRSEPATPDASDVARVHGHVHSLLDDWIDMQLIARRTRRITPLVIAPFVVLALLVVGHSRLFDTWSLNFALVATGATYLLGAIVLALQLKYTAESARERALARMTSDLRWLEGGPDHLNALAPQFKGLITAVQEERGGAFAPLFEQPLLKAMLLPLGGAGGAQLLEYLVLAK
jgi:hypothetical protein